MSLHAIILAAGASSRMGTPKALLTLGDETFFARAIALAQVAERTLAVVGALPESELRRAAPGTQVRYVANPRPQLGQFSSAVVGARALPVGAAALLLTVDRPRVEFATVQALRDRWLARPHDIHSPQYRGKTGHPLIVPATLVDALRQSDPASGTLRALVRSGRWGRARLIVEDAAVVENIDTPADYAAVSR